MHRGSTALANLFGYSCDSDVLNAVNDDDSDVQGASARRNHIAFTYPFGPAGYSEVFALPSASDEGASLAYFGPMPDEAVSLQLNSEALDSLDFFSLPQRPDMVRSPYSQVEQKANKQPPPASQSPTPASKRRTQRFRKQNRSCDPCRSAKRACDLPPNTTFSNNLPLSPCSMCTLRGKVCTIAWRSAKQSSHNTKKHASDSFVKSRFTGHGPNTIEHTNDGLSPTSATTLPRHDLALVCRTMDSWTCFQKLRVYIHTFDNPISNLLSTKCMPPCYSLGVTALIPLKRNTQLAARFNQAESSIMNSWESISPPQLLTSPTSRLFLTASILDLLFQRPYSHSEHVRLTSRDIALIETYKWVAIATGSQFVVNESGTVQEEKSHDQARDIAYATWCKAKHMVFENIAASKSFRLGLSLLLFGTILPPAGTDRSSDFGEEAAYALHEGIRRLRTLCAEARACLQDVDNRSPVITPLGGPHTPTKRQCLFQRLSPEAHGNVLELIAAFEWLVDMSRSVAIALFPFGSFPDEPSFNNINSECPQVKEFSGQKSGVKSVYNGRNLKPMDDDIIARVKAVTQPVTELWTQGAAEQLVLDTVLELGSFVVIMWKALARLTLATRNWRTGYVNDAEIHQHFNTMSLLIDLWRTTFGTIDCESAKSLQLSPTNVQLSVIFCATDGDLVVLLFYELCCHLQNHLKNQPQEQDNCLREALNLTKYHRDRQRLTSAMQMSYLASANRGVSSSGFQEKGGIMAHLGDIQAHPVSLPCVLFGFDSLISTQHPTMVVQAYHLASKGLAQGIQNSVLAVDIKRISDLSTALECCLRELQGLQSALVMHSAIGGCD
ncbi:hypothetical protein PENSUB_3372 [Penicillium subrubescens]|uniref:Zn(2)-C6 fungal-type domain-containing protein n=1 Tax=Penicillium subrubescens TaxID=1316194 RepID=A0A1Q5UR73_9EURO|nr:hypothetical protein PENSUB_3372 [Penicillium subrubescens]